MYPAQRDTLQDQQQLAIGYHGALAVDIIRRELIGTLLKLLVVDGKPICLPGKDLHACLSLIEEDEYISR
jgi:hypothetical protein